MGQVDQELYTQMRKASMYACIPGNCVPFQKGLKESLISPPFCARCLEVAYAAVFPIGTTLDWDLDGKRPSSRTGTEKPTC